MRTRKVRFIIAAIVTFSAYAVYLSRINLSIAIIAMVEDSAQKEANLSLAQTQAANVTQSTELQEAQLTTKTNNINQNNYDDKQKSYQPNNLNGQYPSWNNNSMQKHEQEPIAPMFPLKGINSLLIMSKEKFDWDQSEQGQIQGAFFFGYILFQIPGARMAESVGAHWIIMVATFGSALISLAFPLSTQLNSIYLLMLLRFVMGLCQSAFFPASYVLFCRWLPEGERSVLLPVMFIGSNIGSISTYIMSAYLIRFNYGWPSVFYLSGLICLLVGGAWAMLGSSGPEDNWLITDEERRFILCNVNNQSSESNSIDERLSDCDEDSEGEKDQQQQDDSLNADDKQEKITFKGLAQEAVKFKLEQLNNNTNVDLNNNNISKPIHSSCQDVVISTSTHCVDTGRVLHKFCSSQAINNNTNNQCNKLHHNSHQLITRHQIAPEPCWPKLLKSIPVWTLILSMYGNEWSNVVLCYELPTYLNTALGYPIERNGVINSFFQFTYAVASPIMSSLGASMLARRTFGMHKIHVRKLFQSLATFGQMSCFLGIAICGLNVDLIILLMFASIVFRACSNAGDIMVAGDLSPEYAGTIFAFANSVGNTAGFVVPFLAGQFITKAHDHDQWTPFWLTTSCILGASGLIFLIFGETKRQDFSIEAQPGQLNDLKLQENSQLGGSSLIMARGRLRTSSCCSDHSAKRRRTSSCVSRC